MKSERLKKLENELGDLEQWMKLGLVPKNEITRHKEEISALKERIKEELERLQFLKENGELEEYTAPKRSSSKSVYPDTASISDVDIHETSDTASFDLETEGVDHEGGGGGGEEEKEATEHEMDEEDPFSDRNRWKRGGILDPDATDW